MRDALSNRVGVVFSDTHPVTAWLVSPDVPNKFQVWKDDKTAYERARAVNGSPDNWSSSGRKCASGGENWTSPGTYSQCVLKESYLACTGEPAQRTLQLLRSSRSTAKVQYKEICIYKPTTHEPLHIDKILINVELLKSLMRMSRSFQNLDSCIESKVVDTKIVRFKKDLDKGNFGPS